jgi:hypothetical protein
VHLARLNERDHARVDLPAGRALEAVGGLDALGRRIVGPVRAHVLGDPEPERPGDRDGEDRDGEHPAGVGVQECGEAAEHVHLLVDTVHYSASVDAVH